MLRKITIGCAVVVAVLAAPVMSAHSMMGGMGGHGFGGMHSAGGMQSFGGMHTFGGPHSFGMVHTFHHAAMFPHHHFAQFHHFAHFRHRHLLFASAVGIGCWEWVPTRWGPNGWPSSRSRNKTRVRTSQPKNRPMQVGSNILILFFGAGNR